MTSADYWYLVRLLPLEKIGGNMTNEELAQVRLSQAQELEDMLNGMQAKALECYKQAKEFEESEPERFEAMMVIRNAVRDAMIGAKEAIARNPHFSVEYCGATIDPKWWVVRVAAL